MGDVAGLLIASLEKRFRWRDEEDEGEGKRDMIEAFGAFSDKLLADAARTIRFTRTASTMPTVGAIREVLLRLAEAQPQAQRPIPPGQKDRKLWDIHAEQAKNWAIDASQCSELGK